MALSPTVSGAAKGLLGGLLGGGGGSGFGVDPSSSTAQSSPFYNDSGINFDSTGTGIEAAPINTGAGPTNPSGPSIPRSYQVSANAQPYGAYVSAVPSGVNTNLYIYVVAALAVAAFFLFRK